MIACGREKAAAGTRAPLKVLSLRDFAREYHLEDAIEPELLWAFTHTYNAPPPEQRDPAPRATDRRTAARRLTWLAAA